MEDDEICLSADTLKVLNEFLHEKSQREEQELANIQQKAGKTAIFEEDWQLSQFWYNDFTKKAFGNLVQQLLQEKQNEDFNIALLSCPSLYATIKEIHNNVKIFEYDQRFMAFGDDFVYYDFNEIETNENFLKDMEESFDLIIADPPFLSEDSITKMVKIMKKLRRTANSEIVFCSGEVVKEWLEQQLDLKKCKFCPQHERNLGNEFACYTNFNLDDLIQNKK